MQIYSGLHMIDAPFENERHINLWLFRGARHILVDSGVAGVPPETILPYLKSVGLEATDLDLLINLHAHADHIGGDAELLTASGGELRIGDTVRGRFIVRKITREYVRLEDTKRPTRIGRNRQFRLYADGTIR